MSQDSEPQWPQRDEAVQPDPAAHHAPEAEDDRSRDDEDREAGPGRDEGFFWDDSADRDNSDFWDDSGVRDDAAVREDAAARDDRPGWTDDAVWNDGTFWRDSPDWEAGAGRDGGRDRVDAVRGRLVDFFSLLRPASDFGGRHAAPNIGFADRSRALLHGRARFAAAAAIVAAVIGIGGAYLAETAHPVSSHHPAGLPTGQPTQATQSPSMPSPGPTAPARQSVPPGQVPPVVFAPPAPTSTSP